MTSSFDERRASWLMTLPPTPRPIPIEAHMLQDKLSKTWSELGMVVDKTGTLTLVVKLGSSRVKNRNRKFLNSFVPDA